MAKIKMQIPDTSRSGRRRLVGSTGGLGIKSSKSATKYPHSDAVAQPITRSAQFAGSGASTVFTQPMFFSPLHTPQNWQIASKRREIYQWARFYYENEPKVAAGVDFYSNFPMNGFTLECQDSKILEHFEEVVERLDLNEWLNFISHEYFLLGDVFPFLEIECPKCAGTQVDHETKEPCNHPGGTIKSLRILNPDYVEVQDNVLADEPVIALMPDEELKMIIQRKQPKQIYDKLAGWLIDLVATGRPIPLSNRSISHLKHNASPYGTYGTSMLRRLFTMLAYKTKIMTANWIIAERLILPIRVVKIGDKDRPATEEDIQDVVNQLAAVSNDPNLTIVTHHAFEYEWYGAAGKIHQIQKDIDIIGKELLDGMMLNQAILNGEMAGYNSAQVGVEIMVRRLENWRTRLKDWVEKRIFLPIAMMQGFVDEKRSKILGRTTYLYPHIKWNEMNLRDNSNKVQILLQMYDKGMVSAQTICSEMDLDYDGEVEKLRQEQMVVSAAGLMPGGQAGAMGGGMGGPMGGGMGGPPGGMAPPPAGGEMGGEMPGMAAGAMPGMMPMGGAEPGMAAASEIPKITKKGKGSTQEEQQMPQNKMLKLTKLEATMYNTLKQMNIPYRLFGQYEISMPGQQQPFVLDFAFPELGVGIETDGAIWHERSDFRERDTARDQKLSNVGWRILRFSEEAVYDHMDTIQDIIKTNLVEASKDLKKAAEQSDGVVKLAKIRSQVFGKKSSENLELERKTQSGENPFYQIIKLGT